MSRTFAFLCHTRKKVVLLFPVKEQSPQCVFNAIILQQSDAIRRGHVDRLLQGLKRVPHKCTDQLSQKNRLRFYHAVLNVRVFDSSYLVMSSREKEIEITFPQGCPSTNAPKNIFFSPSRLGELLSPSRSFPSLFPAKFSPSFSRALSGLFEAFLRPFSRRWVRFVRISFLVAHFRGRQCP